MILTVPQDTILYPTLGEQVCDWIEAHLCFGPGDLRGQPAILDDEKRALIWRMYEVFPQSHARAGRRRFRRCALSLRKGSAKTELSAWLAICELHPDAPVRCIGWTKKGQPIGGPVTDPFVALVAYTEEQSDELAYGAMRAILEDSQVGRDFDIGLERIIRKDGAGKAVSLASSPSSLDGARTTFQVFDETHRMTLPRFHQAHHTMMANLPKRKASDAWGMEITTAPEPGAGSVAEKTMEYAMAVHEGRIPDADLFFFHRQSSDEHDLTTADGARAAVIEASGPTAAWSDIDAIVARWADPTFDRTYWERVYCNRLVKGSSQAFDVERWRELAQPDYVVADEAMITLGFDGALFHDSTAIVATEIETGFQWLAGLWECPPGMGTPERPWQVPAAEVNARMAELFERYLVWRLYADPPYWQEWVSKWAGNPKMGKRPELGPGWEGERVVEWWTNRRRPMTAALESFNTALREGTMQHSGDKDLTRHVGNARKQELPMRDEQGKAMWLIKKDRPDSPHKIDAAMAAVLSREARNDALAAGVDTNVSVYLTRGVRRLGE